MRIAFLIVPLLGVIWLLASAGRQTYLWLRLIFPGASPLVYGLIYGFAALVILALFIASRAPGIGIPRAVLRAGHHALGYLLYLVLIFNLTGLPFLIPFPSAHRLRLVSGIVSLLVVAGLGIYGGIHASNIRTRAYEIHIGRGAAGTLRIALISDLHLGYAVDEGNLRKIVAAVNAAEPDLILIAGDIFDGDMTALSDPAQLKALFREMDAAYGVYACLGNHDAGSSYGDMLEFLEGAHVRLLRDEAVIVGGKIVLAGRRDSAPIGGQGEGRGALELPAEAERLPVIVMDHQPGNIGEYGPEVDLILSGHSHRGQMFPFQLITNAVFDVDYGYYQAPNAPQVVVTSGAGTWGPPMRIGTDNEVAVVEVVFAAQ